MTARTECDKDKHRPRAAWADATVRHHDNAYTQAEPNASPGKAPAFGTGVFVFQGTAIRYVNPALEAMTGYTARELVGMPFWEVIHPDEHEMIRERGLARQRGDAVPWQYEVRLLRKSGEALWVECSAGLIEFDGRPAVFGTAIDITERRAAAKQLRDTERRSVALIENSSDMVVVTDAAARLCYVGPSIERILGFRPEELIGNDGMASIHPDDRERVRVAYTEMTKSPGSRAIAAYRTLHRDGSWRWLESIGSNLLDDPSIAGIIVNSRDITERVEAEAAYRNLVEHSLQALVIIQDGRIVFCNRATAEMTGYAAEELTSFGMDPERGIVHPDDAAVVWQKWARRRDGEPVSARTEFRLLHKDGGVRWLETYATAIEYRGRPAVQVTYIDISERRRAEEHARALQQELAHVLRRRTMGEMAAVLAHELNQPLAAIMNYVEGCAQRLRSGGGSPQSLLAALDQIGAQALRASEVIRQLRGFVRERGSEREVRHVNDLVEEVIRFIGAETQGRGVRVRVELASNLPPLPVEAVQIQQVILNLVRNALEAIYESPGKRPLLIVSTRRAGDEVEVAVRDSGAGVPADIAAEIFEPFVTSKSEGLGMGLSICRSIVEAHGGRVWSTANTERGMTFCFTLPLLPSQQRASGDRS
jgi:two-component system sensor kinase FixL